MKWIDSLSWPLVLIMAGLLGLAPFSPAPHIWEKLQMLMAGQLTAPLDIFDLLVHGAPWAILAVKSLRLLSQRRG